VRSRAGYRTGIDLPAVLGAAELVGGALGIGVPALPGRAGISPPPRSDPRRSTQLTALDGEHG
jgi:hypothetical protein